ncbi:hypothetical protein H9X57_15160 [Flavobacterium piscinae]|uniref:hypothetical protein n=1 Tax=Flavobacterium piscinae TaxID=2506424 RepID=UPI0019AFB770|nr:hypothetical protein [Flavobacterium piscinae]MBC8884210.1 hypothetical protein [Flavobacterium piscinae]
MSSSSEEICSGETTPLVTVSGAGSYNTFTWSPNIGISGSIGAGFEFNPTTTTTYTLTAAQTSGALCTNVATITVTVNPLPPAIAIVPASATICENDIQPLSASVGSATATVVYSEDFNSGAPGWVANKYFHCGGCNGISMDFENKSIQLWKSKLDQYFFE